MVEESNSSSAGKMEINDIGVKKEISFVAEVSCVKEKMSSEVSSEGNDSSNNTNEIVPRLKTEESEDCPNDCVPPFCFVGIKTEEPEGYESGESCASSGKVPSGGESANNVERECSEGLNEKSGVELSNHPTCVDIKTESDEDVDTNSRPDSTSSVHRCDMGHSSNEFIRGIECPNFPILCAKQEKEEENVKDQSAGNTNNSASNEMCGSPTMEEFPPESGGQPKKSSGDEVSFTCSICSAVFNSEVEYDCHVGLHKSDEVRIGKFMCTECNASFSRNYRLKRHMTIHTGERPYFCQKCGISFRLRNLFKRHMRKHTGDKPYSCQTCVKSFRVKSHYNEHMRIHTGEKPFFCGACKSSFSRKYSLKKHMLIHTDEKPYSCGICDASFREKGQVKLHRRIHSGEKPFSCETCNASFREKGQLKRHMQIHSGNKPFSCGTCEASFSLMCKLSLHMRTHAGE